MNKNDLKNGMMVVANNNNHYLFMDNSFKFYGDEFFISANGWVELSHYDEELTIDGNKSCSLSIKEIYTADGPYSIYEFFKGKYDGWSLLWQRPFEGEGEVKDDSK